MEASGSFHGRLEAQRLPRKLSRKLFAKAFEVVSTKNWKIHPRNLTFYFHRSFTSFHGISAASTIASTDIFIVYTTVPPVELTTFSTTWLTHTVYETKRVSPYALTVVFHWVGVIHDEKSMSTTCRKLSQRLSWQ